MRYSATSGARQNRQAQIFLLNHSDRHNPKITFFSFPFHRSSSVLDFDTAHTAERNISLHVASLTIVLHWVIQDFDTRQKKLNNAMQIQQWSRTTWRGLLHAVNGYMCVHIHTMWECVCVGCISPSTHAGRARVVPAICPLRQAQRAVCLAIVRLGWLLSLFNITISHVPTANWPVEDTHMHTYISESVTLKIKISVVKSCYINFNMKV